MQVREIPGSTFWQTIEEVKKSEKNVMVCFYGDRQENGVSWCPDCAKGTHVNKLVVSYFIPVNWPSCVKL